MRGPTSILLPRSSFFGRGPCSKVCPQGTGIDDEVDSKASAEADGMIDGVEIPGVA